MDFTSPFLASRGDLVVLEALDGAAHSILATRYLAVASLTVVVFDAVENFPGEWKNIWTGRRGFERSIFLVHRVVVPLGLICAVLMRVWKLRCKAVLGMMVLFAFVSIGLADGLVTMEVWQLWGCDRTVLKFMRLAFAITYAGSAAFIISSYVEVWHHFSYQQFEHLKLCVLEVPPRILTGTWACGLVFELAVFFSTLWNVLSKPRSGNTRLTEMLYRDGSLYFVGVMALRLTNMVTSLVSEPASFFMLMFPSWALVTVLVNRLVANQSRERQHLRRLTVQMADDLGTPPPVVVTRTVTRAHDYEMGVRRDIETSSMAATLQDEDEDDPKHPRPGSSRGYGIQVVNLP